MAIYGNKAMDFDGEINVEQFSEGYSTINSAMRDPAMVNVVGSDNKYYVSSESVMGYMDNNAITEVEEALYDIARANDIDYNLLETVGSFDDGYCESLNEDSVVLEKAAEDNAMTLKQAEKYYNTVIKNCKSKPETKKQIDDCIKLLEECVRDMQRAKTKAESDALDGGRIKYTLKSLIPFNSIWRLFKRNDWEAAMNDLLNIGLVTTTNIIVSGMSKEAAKDVIGIAQPALNGLYFGIRFGTYTKMLDRMIKNTNEAIAYLKKKRKEL